MKIRRREDGGRLLYSRYSRLVGSVIRLEQRQCAAAAEECHVKGVNDMCG